MSYEASPKFAADLEATSRFLIDVKGRVGFTRGQEAQRVTRSGKTIKPYKVASLDSFVPAGFSTVEQGVERMRKTLTVDQRNLAIGLGVHGEHETAIIGVDFDGPAALELRKQFDFPKTFTVQSGADGSFHCYFYAPRGAGIYKLEFTKSGTIQQTERGYFILPGSWHADAGRHYTVKADRPVVVLPEELYSQIRKTAGKAKQRARQRVEQAKADGGALIKKGGRNNTLVSYSAYMHSVGMPLSTVLAATIDLATNHVEGADEKEWARWRDGGGLEADLERLYRDDRWSDVEELDPFLMPDYRAPEPRTVEKRPTFNDNKFADYFARQHLINFRYVVMPSVSRGRKTNGYWIGWNKRFWTPGCDLDVDEACLRSMESAYKEHAEHINPDDPTTSEEDKKYKKRAMQFLMRENYRGFMDRTVANARGRMRLPFESLDADPWLLAVGNGVLDLKTLELREPRREDWLTHGLSVNYVPDAPRDNWLAFVREVTCGDDDLSRYLQRWGGYCTTGDIDAQRLQCWIGEGGNGKGTIINVWDNILGSYAKELSFASLMQPAKQRGGSEATPDLVGLVGKRLVYCDENESGQKLNQARIQLMTGTNKMTVRDVYAQEITFMPNFKLTLVVNHKPELNVSLPAIRRRVHMVPFKAEFSDELGNRREGMSDLLLREREGILAWLIEGLRMYREEGGLGTCAAVREQTMDYFSKANICAEFVEEECEIETGALYPALALRDDFGDWCDRLSKPRRAKDDISAALKALGYYSDRRTIDGQKITYYGGLRPKGAVQ